MITQLVYSSTATERMPKSKLYAILHAARTNNKLADVTGLDRKSTRLNSSHT